MFGKIALVTYGKDFEWREIEREKKKTHRAVIVDEESPQIRAWTRTLCQR